MQSSASSIVYKLLINRLSKNVPRIALEYVVCCAGVLPAARENRIGLCQCLMKAIDNQYITKPSFPNMENWVLQITVFYLFTSNTAKALPYPPIDRVKIVSSGAQILDIT